MTDAAMSAALPIELQLWLSPSFPAGSFAYSHGLEWAAGCGLVHDRASAAAWLSDLLAHGSARNDAILLAEGWRATAAKDWGRLAQVGELAIALAGSRERSLETVTQGNAFLSTLAAAWASEGIDEVRNRLSGEVAYPVAVGAAAAARSLPLEATVQAYVAAFVSNLVSALVRVGAIGQTDGQRVLAQLAAEIAVMATGAESMTLEDIGGAAFMSDIAAQAHETQETRMFRS